MKQLTDEEFVAQDGQFCPCCGSDDLNQEDMSSFARRIYQEVSCNTCHAAWNAIFRLTEYDLVYSGDGDDTD